MFSVVHAMLLRAGCRMAASRRSCTCRRWTTGVAGTGGARHSAATLVALRERTTSFTGIAGVGTGNYIIAEGGDPEQVRGAELTPDGFDVLQARAAIGRTFGASENAGPGE